MPVNQDSQISVGGSVVGSHITINQSGGVAVHSHSRPDYIKYVPDPDSCRELGPAGPFSVATLATGTTTVLAGVGAFADMAGLLSYMNIPKNSVTLGVLGLFAISGALFVYCGRDERRIAQHQKRENPSPRPGILYKELGGSRVLSYKLFAPCSYPECNGKVVLVDAPSRERVQHKYIGMCQIGGKQHTYTVDPNLIGIPREFDWSTP